MTARTSTPSAIGMPPPQETLNGVINSIKDGAAIYDANDRLVQFNPPYLKYFSLIDDILKPGISFREIFEALAERGLYDGPKSGTATWVDHRVKLFESGAKRNEIQRTNGRWACIDYYKMEGGGTFVVTADITAQKQMEASLRKAENESRQLNQELKVLVEERSSKLRKSEALFKAVVNHSPAIIIIKDLEGRFTLFNKHAEKLFAVHEEDCLGKTSYDLFPKQTADHARDHDLAVINTKKPVETEERFFFKNSFHTFLTTRFAIFENDIIIGVGSVGTDITKRVHTEAELHHALEIAETANNSKSRFLATMSHEFRTPLNAIIGFSEMMNGQYFGPLGKTIYRDYAGHIHSSGEHLLSLINDILDISAIEAEKRPLIKEPVDLVSLVEDCVNVVALSAKKADILLVTNTPNEPIICCADARAVKQILINLMANAIKFSEGASTVTLSVDKIDDKANIRVADQGIGIDAHFLPTITEPFARTHPDVHLAQEGTGLGLAIVKLLVDAHDGQLTIDSERHKGTTVTVSLPI